MKLAEGALTPAGVTWATGILFGGTAYFQGIPRLRFIAFRCALEEEVVGELLQVVAEDYAVIAEGVTEGLILEMIWLVLMVYYE